MEEQGLTSLLAAWASGLRFEDIPPLILSKIKVHILDTFGVMLGGVGQSPSKIVFETMAAAGGTPDASVVGYGISLPAMHAAIINGTSAHSVELDDGCAGIHPGAPVVPAAFAIGERVGADGKQFITAVLAGYEVALRINMATFPWLRRRGFHPTGACGCFGAAAAVARILKLGTMEMTTCLGLAGTQATAIRSGSGLGSSMMKRLHPGKAAQNGVLAALLAERGYLASDSILEGERGFLNMFAIKYDQSVILKNLGETYLTHLCYIKSYAACRHIHGPIDSLLGLWREYEFEPENVIQITLRIYREGTFYTKKHPESFSDAQFSMPFCLAVALVEKQLLLPQFRVENLRCSKIAHLAEKINIVYDEEMDKCYKETKKRAHILEVKLQDGQTLKRSTYHPKGDPKNPLTKSELRDKFLNLAQMTVSERDAEDILRLLENMEDINNLHDLGELLRGAKR